MSAFFSSALNSGGAAVRVGTGTPICTKNSSCPAGEQVQYTVASLACGLAPSLGVLVGLRLLQAAGAAMLQANSVALVTTSAPKDRMRFALGVQAGAQSVGLALGPTLGGLLTSTIGWRAGDWGDGPLRIARRQGG